MLSNPPSTGDAKLDNFLKSVKRHIDDALRPADGWRLSDFSADVSEVISDKRDLIDIVTRYDDINALKDSVDLVLADFAEAIADSKALENQYQDHAEVFTHTMEWWNQNRKIIEDAAEVMAATILASDYADAAEASALRAGNHEDGASQARDAAVTAKNEASTSATNAATSATSAATSAGEAATSEDTSLDAAAAAIAAAGAVGSAMADEVVGHVAGWTADAVGGRNLVPNSDFTRTDFPAPWKKAPQVNTDPDGTKYASQNYGWGVELWLNVEPGSYTVSLDARDTLENPRSQVRASITMWDSEGVSLEPVSIASGSLTATFQREEMRIEVPAGTVQMRMFLLNQDANPGNSYLDITRIKLERGPRATPWTPAPEDAALHVQAGNSLSSLPSPFLAHDPATTIRVDNSVGTRVFVGGTMIHGDTRWRRLDTLIVAENFTAGSLIARRLGNTVEIVGYNIRAYENNADLKTLLTLPEGFLPGHTARYGSTYWGKRWTLTPGGLISLAQGEGSDYFNVAFITSDPWPTTLPGTPV